MFKKCRSLTTCNLRFKSSHMHMNCSIYIYCSYKCNVHTDFKLKKKPNVITELCLKSNHFSKEATNSTRNYQEKNFPRLS